MQDFRKLIVWQKAHQLVLAIYEVTKDFPREEVYGLTAQIRRSCASIPTNLAEGCGRGSNAELSRFVYIAMGSASELEYQLLLAYDLAFINSTVYQRLNADLIEVKKMLNAFVHKLSKTNN